MANPFSEIRFDPGIIPRGVGGPVYKTTVIRTGLDFERRNSSRTEYLFEGDIGEVLLDERQVSYIIAFFNARKGMVEGFRYKYWGDYNCTHAPWELGPDTTTQGVTQPATGDGTTTVFQLRKQYQDAGDVTYKTITKPVEETVQVYVEGELRSDAVIDHATGQLTFPAAPAANATIAWSGEFDLPIWFNTDTLSGVQMYHSDGTQVFETDRGELFRFESLPVVELPVVVIPPEPQVLCIWVCLSNKITIPGFPITA